MFRAVSPWATMPLHEVCSACGREISGSGFVILDYEELGPSVIKTAATGASGPTSTSYAGEGHLDSGFGLRN